jgi:AcrR family transcriptional regulator
MRITAEAKTATRQRILKAAARLFETKGFDATTTRDIALSSGTATGTLFNYFPTKEAIVTELVADALAGARHDLGNEAKRADSLEEDLFALVAGELRRLQPLRKFILPMIETVMSPLAASDLNGAGHQIRSHHLEIVAELAGAHDASELSAVALQLYWTLYMGVLAFWASDRSPKQEESLALLDQSLGMFVRWLTAGQAAGLPNPAKKR